MLSSRLRSYVRGVKLSLIPTVLDTRHGKIGTVDVRVGAQISILGRQMRLMQVGGRVGRRDSLLVCFASQVSEHDFIAGWRRVASLSSIIPTLSVSAFNY